MNARTMPIPLTAGWREAVRARDPYIDLDHLLIGLIAAGGPAARVLTSHGINLPSLRTAAHAFRANSLAMFGIDVDALATTMPRSIDEMNRDVSRMPMAERVDKLVDGLGVQATERDLLLALLLEPSGMIRKVIEHNGTELARLVGEIDGSSRWSTPTPQRSHIVEAEAKTRTAAVQLEHFVPADPELVRSVATDPDRARQWLTLPNTVRQEGGGLVRSLALNGRNRDFRLSISVDKESHVSWDETRDGQRFGWYDLRLTQVDGGTMVTLVHAVRTAGILASALTPLTRLTNGLGLLLRAQNLSLACIDKIEQGHR